MIPGIQPLLNAGSKSLNVNGSSSPKTFSFTASQDTRISGLVCLLKDDGTTSLNKFGTLTALSNGVLIQVTIGGNITTLATIIDNADLCTTFHYNQFGNSAILSILGISTPLGFGNSNNVFVGYWEFNERELILQNGDSISVYIQDDLRSIDTFQMSCKTYKD